MIRPASTFAARLLCAGLALLVSGCSTAPLVQPLDPVDAKKAYVLIQVDYGKLGSLDATLMRVRPGTPPVQEAVYLPRIEVGEPTLLELEPGVYYLHRLVDQSPTPWALRHEFDPRFSSFEVIPGQISFPGRWQVRIRVLDSYASGTAGNFSAGIKMSVEPLVNFTAPDAKRIAARYPAHWAAGFRLHDTRIQVTLPEAAK